MLQPDLTARARAENVARASYGRLLAILAAPTGDIPSAEDALSDAFVQALTTWPAAGIPLNPDAWILQVARNRQRDRYRSAAFRTSSPLDILEHPRTARGTSTRSRTDPNTNTSPSPSPSSDPLDLDAIPDKRLALMFVCAHPAIDAGIRTPLTLHTVLGFDAAQIAEAFAIPAPAMAQRLVRAKRRIKDARIPFVVPERSDMPARLPAVLEAIYGTYAIDWQRASGVTLRESLSAEALYLATTLADLLPDEPEVLGLAALICLSLSRTDARQTDARQTDATRNDTQDFVPLQFQDTSKWNSALIARGDEYLSRAHSSRALGSARIGRFQLEAALQSAHCARAFTGVTDWAALRTLTEALLHVAPTLGALVSLAAIVGEIDGPNAGLAILNETVQDETVRDGTILDETATTGRVGRTGESPLQRFQPAWATRAHLLREAGRDAEATIAFEKAISLTTDPALRRYLRGLSTQR